MGKSGHVLLIIYTVLITVKRIDKYINALGCQISW